MSLLLGFVVCRRQPSGDVVGLVDEDGVVEEDMMVGMEGPMQESLLSFSDGVLSPTFLERQFGADGAYYADWARCLQESPQVAYSGSSSQAHAHAPVDLNEPASDLFGDFSFVLGGTPPSAFVDVPAQEQDDDQAQHVVGGRAEHDGEDPEPRRGRRVTRRRGCGAGGICRCFSRWLLDGLGLMFSFQTYHVL
ncbi:hypothetical protein PIB30_014356 [Stylosanthes scabra]|uniref:Uncharacterized protein n=1 Tax=Stylosanthes scabra TaxID=79078 RepID=A0ABU6S6V2_9FABA|nr:hypothetical protein [Stylosanthes scabra]